MEVGVIQATPTTAVLLQMNGGMVLHDEKPVLLEIFLKNNYLSVYPTMMMVMNMMCVCTFT